jgi:hypothetical protein
MDKLNFLGKPSWNEKFNFLRPSQKNLEDKKDLLYKPKLLLGEMLCQTKNK